MVDLWIKLLITTLCLQIIPCKFEIDVQVKDNTTALSNISSNVTAIANPIKSLSLHLCPSARAANNSGINSTGLQNNSEITHHIPIAQLIPPSHELKSISINFDAKCLSKLNPLLIGKTETEKISRIETTDIQRENTQTEQIIKTTPWDNLDGKKYTEKNGK
ncbi:unnamed protein product [Schistosoma bovis]|nr:unnamed protein product [Schistosoma bovis]